MTHRVGETIVREVHDSDCDAIIEIINYYAATSYAAYPEVPANERVFAFLRERVLAFYVVEREAHVVGFGLMKPFMPFPAFMTTGLLTCFIQPEFTRMGLGKKFLDRLTDDATKMDMTSLVVNMESKNIPSILFHTRYGFSEVGRLQDAGIKFGEQFDIILMQKML